MNLAALAAALAALAPAPARADDVEREGGRFGVSALAGYASAADRAGASAGMGLAGVALRFGGAFTDRFHLLGVLTLAASPGASLPSGAEATAFHAGLDLAAQGFIGPRFFVRGGVGVGWAAASAGNTWHLPIPGPRVAGALGYDLWRDGQRSLSVAVESSYAALFNSAALERTFALGLGVGFDWY